MRDLNKSCGITIHQKANETSNLGEKCPEFPFKDIKGIRKRKLYHPPTDCFHKVYLGVIFPELPFSVYLWYVKQNDEDPDLCCVDLTVDGKRSPGWILRNGRQNGVLIDSILQKGTNQPFEFSPARQGLISRGGVSGIIQATFWREKNGETGEDHLDYIPDEGLPALAVLSLFYHEMDFLTSNCIIKQKKQLKKNALNSELSTTLSSPLLKNEQKFTFEKLLALNAEKSKTRLPFSVINTIENNRSYEISKIEELESDPFLDRNSCNYKTFSQLLYSNRNVDDFNDLDMQIDNESNENTTVNVPFKRRRRVPITCFKNEKTIIYRLTIDKGQVISTLQRDLIKMVSGDFEDQVHFEWENENGIKMPLTEHSDINEIQCISALFL